MASAGSLLSPCSEKSASRRKSDLAMILPMHSDVDGPKLLPSAAFRRRTRTRKLEEAVMGPCMLPMFGSNDTARVLSKRIGGCAV